MHYANRAMLQIAEKHSRYLIQDEQAMLQQYNALYTCDSGIAMSLPCIHVSGIVQRLSLLLCSVVYTITITIRVRVVHTAY
jgi:hypothetical protein